ncbi:MAG: AMP-binding protein [Candidatus Omnitrophota bacterium]|jgi:long-chain acyl-CoA synthetase
MAANIFEELQKIVRLSPEKPAFFFEEDRKFKSLSFRGFLEQTIRLGEKLAVKGIKQGDMIAILIENQPEWPVSFMAAQYIGAIAVPLDVKLPKDDLLNLIVHCGAKTLLCTEKTFETAGGKDLKNVINAEIISIKQAGGAEQKNKAYPSENQSAAMFYTSGTTDNPKGVLLSHKNFLANIKAIKQLHITTRQDVFISILPLHHTYSFTVTCLLPLLEGASISYPASISPDDFLRCMQETKTTMLVGVPQLFALLQHGINNKLKKLSFIGRFFINRILDIFLFLRKTTGINLSGFLFSETHKKFGSKLRFMISGGARLDPELADDLFRWGFTILEGYGLTETAPIIAFNPVRKVKFGSVGKPLPGVEVEINSPDENGIGEIIARGDNIMLGYYNREEDTRRAIREGWFFTGDLGYMDQDEYIHITGRKDELIILNNGKKVNPEELEHHYGMSPYVKEVCVFSSQVRESSGITQKLTAIVIPDEDYFRSREVVNMEDKIKWEFDNISHRLPSSKRIQRFLIGKKKLPRTPLGKIMRHKIDAEYLSDSIVVPEKIRAAAAPGDETLLSNETNRKIIEYLSNRLKKPVYLDDHIELNLGLDSLGRVELFLDVQQLLNLDVSDSLSMELFYVNTIRELILKIMPFYAHGAAHSGGRETKWSGILKQKPSSATLNSIALKPSIIDTMVNFFFYAGFNILFHSFIRIKIEGKENIPAKGPYLIYPNHTSYLDGFLIAGSLPFKKVLTIYFLVFRDYISVPIVKTLARAGRLIPVNITLDIMELLKTCSFLLDHSKPICFFPEGERSTDGKIIKFKKGIGILAKESKIPLIPAYIDGAYETWSRYSKFPRPGKITVRFGKPIVPGKDLSETDLTVLSYEEIAERLRQELLKLKNK